MRPDHLINKANGGSGHNHGYLQSSAYRTNRYLTITNNTNGTGGSVTAGMGSATNLDAMQSASSSQISAMSKDAKSFQKSLRKSPKGIYMNYEELVELVQGDNKKIFNQLIRRINSLKKQVTFLLFFLTFNYFCFIKLSK